MGQGCGVIKMDNSLYFNDVGPREAETSPVNTTAIKYATADHLQERDYFSVLELVYTVVISSVNPFRTKTPKYLFPRGNKPLFYHQIGNTNFVLFITNQ